MLFDVEEPVRDSNIDFCSSSLPPGMIPRQQGQRFWHCATKTTLLTAFLVWLMFRRYSPVWVKINVNPNMSISIEFN